MSDCLVTAKNVAQIASTTERAKRRDERRRVMRQADVTASFPSGTPYHPQEDRSSELILVLRSDRPLGPSHRFSLADLDAVTIGRGSQLAAERTSDSRGRCLSIVVPDRHISTCHVQLHRLVKSEWMVEDAGSKNGTALNGARCDRADLRDGDVLEVGCSQFLYRVSRCRQEGHEAGPHLPPLDVLATMSPSLAARFAAIGQVAPSRLSILLLGRTGVGKEVVARAVHELSRRRGAFVAVNCGSIPPNLVESTMFGHRRGAFSGASETRPGMVRSAEAGTLFLDEIGELSLAAQASLLRVLQEHEVVPIGESRPVPVDVRYVAATNRDLRADIEAGHFREDLFARLAGLVVDIPPLHERKEDLGLLIARLLRRVAPDPERIRMTPRAARALLRHDWPRNVRELETCLSSAVILAAGKDIDLAHLPREIWEPAPLRAPARAEAAPAALEESVATLLEAHQGNISAVARALSTSRSQVRRLLKRHGVVSPSRAIARGE